MAEPPTDEELEAMLRRYAINVEIPAYLREVQKWMMTHPADLNLANVEACAERTEAAFKAGDYALARFYMAELDTIFSRIKNAAIASDLSAHGRIRDGQKRATAAKAAEDAVRNEIMAKAYIARRQRSPSESATAAKVAIGRNHDLKRSAAIAAINAGLQRIRSAKA